MKRGELEQQIICYLSMRGKVRVEALRKALGASKSFYRTLAKLKDAGLIEIEVVSHKERYVKLARRPTNVKFLNLLKTLTIMPIEGLDNVKERIKRINDLLEYMEKQILIGWWSFVRSVTSEAIILPEVIPLKDHKEIKPKETDLTHLFELSPSEVKNLVKLTLNLQETVLRTLGNEIMEKIFRVSKERLKDLLKELKEIEERSRRNQDDGF